MLDAWNKVRIVDVQWYDARDCVKC